MSYTVRCGETDEKADLLFASDESSFNALSEAVKTDSEVRFYSIGSAEDEATHLDFCLHRRMFSDRDIAVIHQIIRMGKIYPGHSQKTEP